MDRLNLEAIQQQKSASKYVMAPIEKKLKSTSSTTSQKSSWKPLVPENSTSEKVRRRGRPATPSGTPPDFIARTDFKNGQLIRINKQIKALHGLSTNKGGVRKSCFEVIASGPSGKGCKTQAKMQFECEQKPYEFLEQHGYKMTPNNLNQFFNQVLKTFPESGGSFNPYTGLMEQMRYRPQFDEESAESQQSCNKTYEVRILRFFRRILFLVIN